MGLPMDRFQLGPILRNELIKVLQGDAFEEEGSFEDDLVEELEEEEEEEELDEDSEQSDSEVDQEDSEEPDPSSQKRAA